MYLDAIALFGVVQDGQSRSSARSARDPPKAAKYRARQAASPAIPNAKNKEGASVHAVAHVQAAGQAGRDVGGSTSRWSTLEDPEAKKKYPEFAVLKDALKIANPHWRPIIPEWDELNQQVLGIALSDVITGKKAPKEALGAMVPRAEEIMRKGGYYKT
jgi:multiple sugar transport system substrate-binding protein